MALLQLILSKWDNMRTVVILIGRATRTIFHCLCYLNENIVAVQMKDVTMINLTLK